MLRLSSWLGSAMAYSSSSSWIRSSADVMALAL
jgi:hypothetical protein